MDRNRVLEAKIAVLESQIEEIKALNYGEKNRQKAQHCEARAAEWQTRAEKALELAEKQDKRAAARIQAAQEQIQKYRQDLAHGAAA